MFCWLQEAHFQTSGKMSFFTDTYLYGKYMKNINAYTAEQIVNGVIHRHSSTTSLMFTMLYLRIWIAWMAALQHENTYATTTTATTSTSNNKNRMCSLNWEIEYREKQFETRWVRLRVVVSFLQYASTATVLSCNRLIFKLFQISELKRYANGKIQSNRI